VSQSGSKGKKKIFTSLSEGLAILASIHPEKPSSCFKNENPLPDVSHMRTNFLALFACILLYQCVQGQALTIQSGANLFVRSGAILSVDSLVIQPSTDLDITGPSSITKNTAVTYPASNPYIGRVYHFSNAIPLFSGTITMYYQDAELNGIPENALTLNVHDGTSWTAYTTGVSSDATANYVTTSGLSGIEFSELTLANQSTPLPLHWLGIEAFAVNQNNQIDWKTTDEVSIKHFQLQKSKDGVLWVNEGSIVVAHNTPGVHHYSYTDIARYTPVTFYRVFEKDQDGHGRYSPVVSVRVATSASILLTPNPAINQIQIKSPSFPVTSLVIFNAAGSRVYTVNNINQNIFAIPVAGLPKGCYFISMVVHGNTVSASFIRN
jgi:hypothetical protein